jgi:hypothetical protein
MEMVIERFSIFLVRLDPTAGAETANAVLDTLGELFAP